MSVETNYQTLRDVLFEYEPQGWALEFGVYTGRSLNIISEHMPVIGFDSFLGLPEDWRPGFSRGKFRKPAGLDLPHTTNAMIVKGLFADSLPIIIERGLPPIGLVHIDCDLYSSTKTVLDLLTPVLDPGTILVFDEFHGYPGSEEHEAKAFTEWLNGNGVRVEQIAEGPEETAFRVGYNESAR